MKNNIQLIWSNRIKKRGVNGLKVWLKRLISAPRLLFVETRLYFLKFNGLTIGEYSIIGCEISKRNISKLTVGSNTYISSAAQLSLHGRITVGSCVVINSGVKILTGSHDVNDIQWRLKIRDVVIGDYAWIATDAIVLPGVKIGRGAVVGAGAVVRGDVPDYSICIGNPAKIIGERRIKEFNYSPTKFVSYYSCWLIDESELRG